VLCFRPHRFWHLVYQGGAEPWTDNISHGKLIRDGVDETLTIDPANPRFLFQGMLETHEEGKGYGAFQWRPGILDPE
jgi:hypothetical protein